MLSAQINLKQLDAQGVQAELSRLQQGQALQRQIQNDQFNQSKIDRTGIREVNGRQVRDRLDARGNIVGVEDLGPVEPPKPSDPTPQLFMDKDGRQQWVKPGNPVPAGFKKASDRDPSLRASEEVKLKEHIANYDASLSTGKVGGLQDGKPLDPSVYPGLVQQYNDSVSLYEKETGNKAAKYMLLPERQVPGKVFGTNTAPPKPIKLPYSTKASRYLTQEDIEFTASKRGTTVYNVLKELGVNYE